MKLNLGCGKDIRNGWVNVDYKEAPGIDLIHDIRKPLPFPSDSVKYVLAQNVLEHIMGWEDVVIEVHRVLQPKGRLEIHVPYRLNCMTFHKRYFDEDSMKGFVNGSYEFFSDRATTLEGESLFILVNMTIDRRPFYPYAWHLKKYLKIPYIGRKWAITYLLEKR